MVESRRDEGATHKKFWLGYQLAGPKEVIIFDEVLTSHKVVAITRMGGGGRAATAHFIDEYAATAIEAGRRGQLARALARKERAARAIAAGRRGQLARGHLAKGKAAATTVAAAGRGLLARRRLTFPRLPP